MAGMEDDSVKVPLQDTPHGTPKLGLKLSDDNSNSLSGSHSQLRKIAEKRLQVSVAELCDLHDNITLSWKDVSVFAPVKSGGKCGGRCRGKNGGEEAAPEQLLSNVSGVVTPGTLLAIMGASGAGKTMLLNALTHRNNRRLTVKGKVCVNGQYLGPSITAVSAYVQQMDLFIGSLKVREHLWFCAELRMDHHLTNEARSRRVNDVMNELGLAKCADTIIGTPGKTKGISGGERKRLAFASEILVDPALMFCDEPTSGLDAFMAQSVVETLKQMASNGKTIVCTIHQPASEVYALFDRILLLAEGRVAYMGPSSQALDYFKSVGYECPANFNPADFFIHTLAVMPGKEDECREVVKSVCDDFEQSSLFDEIKNEVNTIHRECEKDALDVQTFACGLCVVDDLKTRSLYKVSALKQFQAVFWRCWLVNVREPMLMKARIVQTIIAALVTGLIFLRQSYNQKSIMNLNGALFIMLVQVSYTNCLAVLNTFPLEFPVYRREHSNGMYRPSVYFLCKSFAELPIFLILPFLYTAIVYWMIGFHNDATSFLIAAVVIVICTNIAVSFGYVMSISVGTVSMALSVAPVLMMPLLLFGGFFLNSGSVPVYFIWLEYLSWFKYGQEVLVVNQWQDVSKIDCEYASNVTSDSTPCFDNGQQVIDSLSFSESNIAMDFLAMFILLFGFRIISYLLLRLKSGVRK